MSMRYAHSTSAFAAGQQASRSVFLPAVRAHSSVWNIRVHVAKVGASRGNPASSRSLLQPVMQCSAAAVQASATTAEGLQVPHGGNLVNLMAPASQHQSIIDSCTKTIECSDRNACDVELLVVGGFSPLEGFMNQAEYDSVVANMRLTNGLLFGLPIEKGYVTADVAAAEKLTQLSLSGTKFRKMLRAGEDIPEWFAFKSVVQVLRQAIQEEEEASN
eukprot:gene4949-5190_t